MLKKVTFYLFGLITTFAHRFCYILFQASLRNDSLLQSSIRIKNDTQKDTPNNKSAKGLSPQNSIRCSSNTHKSVSAQVICSSIYIS